MNSDREMTRIVRSWLEEGPYAIPDHVLDGALAGVSATPQRRHWWQAWRKPFVMNTMRLALTGGVVVLATFIGIGLYFHNQGGLIGPQPAPSPTIEPSPSPPPIPALQVRHGVDAPAGTYITSSPFPVQIEFTVPDGWQMFHVAADAVGVMKNAGEPPTGSGFGFWMVQEVYLDPCEARMQRSTYVGPSVDHLADALEGLEGYSTTSPVDISLGGFSGKYLEITAPADLSGCDFVYLWRTQAGGDRTVFGPNEHDRIWILDVDGARLLVKIAYRPGTPGSDIAELEQMVESIQIRAPEASTPAPVASPSPLSFSRIGGISGVDVPPATYVTDRSFPLQIQFTVPEGWQRWTAGADSMGVNKHRGEPPYGSIFGFSLVDELLENPCAARVNAPRVDPGPTVDDLANALQGLESFEATTPADVSLGGYGGRYMELSAPAGCAGDLRASPNLFGHPTGPYERYRIWILDVEGTRLVVTTSYLPAAPETDVAELEQIVDSIVIQP